MAKTLVCADTRCDTEFRVGFIEGLFGRPKYCKLCRKGFLLTPADRMHKGVGSFTFAPWTRETHLMTRPAVFGQRGFDPEEFAKRAVLLMPSPEEAEVLRRSMVLASVGQARAEALAGLPATRVIDGEAIPTPETGGGWSDVDLAVPFDDLPGVA